MEEPQEFNISKFFENFITIQREILKNFATNFSGYFHDNRDIALAFSSFISKILVDPNELSKIQKTFLWFFHKQQALFEAVFIEQKPDQKQGIITPQKSDKRFAAPEWSEYPYFNFIKQNYLLTEQLSEKIINEVEISEKNKRKLNFYIDQYINAFSPANFLLSNPEALNFAVKTKGKSLWNGFNNFAEDIQKGRITQVDENAFEVGENIAITPGAVIYENELIQLIQYTPTTKKISEIPLLMIPPWINKYYILDLQSKNSFVKFNIENGITVFMISWRNPMPGAANLSFDDYVSKGALKAIEVVAEIAGAKKINALGYCLGGTLLSIACSILSNNKNLNPINCATFLAAMVDFSNIGPMGNVINEALVKKLERGELLKDGVMHGHDMETAFNLIRANDLIWNYVVNNYLKGIKPAPFDVMFWTNDNTNLPAKMYVYYMRKMILENNLSKKNALRICDTLIDIGKIDIPVFVIAMREDYISPAKTAFVTTELVGGPFQFILGDSGHVMGIVNPPYKKKYGYHTNGKFGYGFEEWEKTSQYVEGSWWTPWTEWIIENSGNKIQAPKISGNENYKVIEPAPGRYVKEKNVEHSI